MAKRRNKSNNGTAVKGTKSRIDRIRKKPSQGKTVVKTQKKQVLGEDAFLAAELHQQRAANLELRKALLQKNAQILKLQEALIEKDQALLGLEEKLLDEQNTALRNKHKLQLGKTLHRDDDTGDVYYLEEEETVEDADDGEPEDEPEDEPEHEEDDEDGDDEEDDDSDE